MRLLKWIGGTTVAVAVAGLVVGGLVAVPVADGVDQYFSSRPVLREHLSRDDGNSRSRAV